MAFRLRKTRVATAEASKPSGGWYADPYGVAARRWYDSAEGWTEQVQGAGLEPDKTGVARVDAASSTPRSDPLPLMDPDSRSGRGEPATPSRADATADV
jgi:hypothetical protein